MKHINFSRPPKSAFSTRIASFALAAFGLCAASVHAAPAELSGRGVFHFASKSGCPLAASGTQADCNRIALDSPGVHASVDAGAGAIVFASDATRRSDEVLGDVLLQGSGVDADGQRVPLSVHVLLRRSGDQWKPDVYAHAPERGKFSDVRIDPYRVSVREAGGERTVLTADEVRALFERPSLASRVARQFVEVEPTDARRPSGDDITIALGVGRLSKAVARAKFSSAEAQAPNAGGLDRALATGTWSIEFDALSSQMPLWAVQRELFLFGLDGSPLVGALRSRSFQKGDKLELGARKGTGYLRVNGHEEAFAGAAASARAFLQESFIGLILAWHRAGAATAAPQQPAGVHHLPA